MARHPGFGCTCEQAEFEDRQREVAEARQTHERELLRRAAEYIDPDVVGTMTYEQRLDWLAKYREVVS